jgi:hypothetical protein
MGRVSVVLMAVVCATALPACLVSSPGATAVGDTHVYAGGGLWATVYGSLDEAYQASLIGLDELGYTVVQWSKDAFGAHVVALVTGGSKATIDLSPESEHVTRIGLRVHPSGDERRILRRIRDNL